MPEDRLRSFAESMANPVPPAAELRERAAAIENDHPDIADGLYQLAGDDPVPDDRDTELTDAQRSLLEILEEKHDIMTADDWAYWAEHNFSSMCEVHPQLGETEWVRDTLDSLVNKEYVACAVSTEGKSFSAYEEWAIDEQGLRESHDLLYHPTKWSIEEIREVEEKTGMSSEQIVRGIGRHHMKEFDF